jgi:hypothetical protein
MGFVKFILYPSNKQISLINGLPAHSDPISERYFIYKCLDGDQQTVTNKSLFLKSCN